MKQRLLGIDIGSYSIKVAEIERSFGSYELVGFYEQVIELEEEGRGKALKRLFEEYDLSGESLYTALPGQLTAFRSVELPFSNFKKVDATIEYEMENYLPLSLEEVVVDYKILRSDKTHSKILVSYARKGEFIKFLNLFAKADLDPCFVGSEQVETANLHQMGVVLPEGTFAVVDLGHSKTNVSLFVGGELRAARTLMIGGKNLTRVVADTLKVPDAEAEKIKVEMGQVGEMTNEADAMTKQVNSALLGPLGDLIVQIRQTLLAFQEDSGEIVPAVLLTGGTSRLTGIDQYFSRELRKNVSFLEVMDMPANRLEDSGWCRTIAATALSLAYRGVLGVGLKDLQLRRGEFAYRGEVRDLVGLIRGVAVQIAVITFFVIGTFFVSYFSLRGKIQSQGQELAAIASEVLPEIPKRSLENPKNVISILSGRVGEVMEKKRKLEEETSLSVVEVLQEVSRILPSRETLEVDVDMFSVAAGRIRFTGKTISFEAVDQIKTALTASPRFQNVATTNVRKGVGDIVKFDISFELKKGEAEGGA